MIYNICNIRNYPYSFHLLQCPSFSYLLLSSLPWSCWPHGSSILADVMSNQGAQTIISVDVGAEDNNDLTNYGEYLSGWWLLWNSLNPFAKKVRVSLAVHEQPTRTRGQ